jgi:hypothetical protein
MKPNNLKSSIMKTTKIIRLFSIVSMLVIFAAISAYAGKPALTPAQHIQKVIKESITYPEQAVKECCTGSVDVYFTVSDDGKIQIDRLAGDTEGLEKMVKEQLSTICCKGIKTPYNEHYKITISFKLIG